MTSAYSTVTVQTETTIDATLFEATKEKAILCSVPIGKPLQNARCYVLNGNGQLVPPDVVGELFIGGEGVSSGYYEQSGRNKYKICT